MSGMGDAEMLVRSGCRNPTSGSPIQKSNLDQVGLINVLDGVFRLADRSRDGAHADRSAIEFLDDGQEELSIHFVKSEAVYIHDLQCSTGRLGVDYSIRPDLRVITNSPEKPIGDSRRSSTASRNLVGAFRENVDAQNAR